MTIIDCCISLKLKMIKKILVVLGVVDMRQLLLNINVVFEFVWMNPFIGLSLVHEIKNVSKFQILSCKVGTFK